MEPLLIMENRGYPTEYLLSRVKGRRAYLITDLKPLLSAATPLEYLAYTRYKALITERSAEVIWRHLLKEFRWVYLQMNGELQDIFWPFFTYSELRTLFFCLRYKAGKKDGKIEDLLAFSLLSERIKKILINSENIISAIKGIEKVFQSLSDKFKDFEKIFTKDGLKGVEQRLTDISLEYIIESKPHPLIRDFFIRIIDSRNIIALYKHLRWEMKVAPYFISGGRISKAKLIEILNKENIFGVLSLIQTLTGIRIQKPDATNIEKSLYKGITQFLKRAGREPLGIGLILDYLWKCSIEAMSLSILLYGSNIDRETTEAELIH